jgi:hypothetical protein
LHIQYDVLHLTGPAIDRFTRPVRTACANC